MRNDRGAIERWFKRNLSSVDLTRRMRRKAAKKREKREKYFATPSSVGKFLDKFPPVFGVVVVQDMLGLDRATLDWWFVKGIIEPAVKLEVSAVRRNKLSFIDLCVAAGLVKVSRLYGKKQAPHMKAVADGLRSRINELLRSGRSLHDYRIFIENDSSAVLVPKSETFDKALLGQQIDLGIFWETTKAVLRDQISDKPKYTRKKKKENATCPQN